MSTNKLYSIYEFRKINRIFIDKTTKDGYLLTNKQTHCYGEYRCLYDPFIDTPTLITCIYENIIIYVQRDLLSIYFSLLNYEKKSRFNKKSYNKNHFYKTLNSIVLYDKNNNTIDNIIKEFVIRLVCGLGEHKHILEKLREISKEYALITINPKEIVLIFRIIERQLTIVKIIINF